MAATSPAPQGSLQPPETPGQLLEDALVAAYDPILWLRDAMLWFLEAGDVAKATATLTIYLDMTQDAMELAADIVNQANAEAATAAAMDGQATMAP